MISEYLMDEGDDSGHEIIGEIDGFGQSILTHFAHFLEVPKQEPVPVSGEALLSQGFLHFPWPKPYQIHEFPGVVS